MKRVLYSITYLAITLSIFKIAIAETDHFITDKVLSSRLDALRKSVKMHFILNNEVVKIIKNKDSNNKTQIKRIVDLYQIVSEYIITEKNHSPAEEYYNMNLNLLIETFNKKFRGYQKTSIDKNFNSLTKNIGEKNKNHYDSYDEQFKQSNKNNEDTKYNNNYNSQELIFFEIAEESFEVMDGKIHLIGLKKKHIYQLSIVGYINHPSNIILKNYYSATRDGQGFYDFKKSKSNDSGILDIQFTTKLPIANYRVKFLVKDISDNLLTIFCLDDVYFKIKSPNKIGTQSQSDPEASGPVNIIYTLNSGIAVCKVNCSSFVSYDCQNKNEREVVNLRISNAKKLLIKGRGIAEASTCYTDGRITAEFESDDDLVSKKGEAVIPCKSSGNFKIHLNFDSVQSGNLSLYLRVSDWCTALTNLKVITITE